MFIYKITIITTNQIYIGMDTKPSYKLSRWSTHRAEAASRCKTKLHKAMKKHGLENCTIEVIEDNFSSIGKLALAEIKYIAEYNSYRAGLNSSAGGDGLGCHNLYELSEEEICQIKTALSVSLTEYNKNIKWANTSIEDRKNLTGHLHTARVYKKKSDSLKKFYDANPDVKKTKSAGIKQWQLENKEKHKEIVRANGAKGAAANSKKIKIEKEDGSVLYFNSKIEFHKATGQWANTIIRKTEKGMFHNGYKAREM